MLYVLEILCPCHLSSLLLHEPPQTPGGPPGVGRHQTPTSQSTAATQHQFALSRLVCPAAFPAFSPPTRPHVAACFHQNVPMFSANSVMTCT